MNPLADSGPIAASGAHIVDQITGVGFGVTILIIYCAVSTFGNVLLFKRVCSLTDQLFNLVPQSTAIVRDSVEKLQEVIRELIQKN